MAAMQDGREAVIEFSDVSVRFRGSLAVEGLNFQIAHGELVAIVGVTGSGKSTTFNLILGLLAPTSGTVLVEGRNPFVDFNWFRRKIAVVFQDARLLPWRTVLDNVCIGMRFSGVPKQSWNETARFWLDTLGLGGRETAYPHQLSGGQRQRVAIARAFAVDPDIILCDESFSALDEATATNLRAEFVKLVRSNGKTGAVITHSIPEALAVGDRVLVFRPPGRIADVIDRDEITSARDSNALRERIFNTMALDAGGGMGPNPSHGGDRRAAESDPVRPGQEIPGGREPSGMMQ